MSCFVVSDFHVDALVSWAVAHRAPAFPRAMSPSALAAALAEANRAAYRERYGEQCEDAARYVARRAVDISPVQIIKACDCLDYQCCDWSGWEASTAKQLLDRIRQHAVGLLPGYDEAAWALDEVTA